jgi:flagellar assembly protein FliH
MTSLSKLIKSSRLGDVGAGSVSIKVAPIFSRKQSEAPSETAVGHSIDFINQTIEKAKKEAASIVEHATKEREKAFLQIEKDKKDWEKERETWKQQAYMEGHEQGYQVGEKEALTEYEARLAEAQRIIDLAKVEHHNKLDSSIESIVTLSMKVAEKVLGCTLETDPSFYTKLVQTALKEVKEKEEIRIYVSPTQYPNILQHKQLLQNIINSQYDLAIYPESDLAEDGCWIDSSAGRMEVSVQTQLAEIKNHLLQLVRMDTE